MTIDLGIMRTISFADSPEATGDELAGFPGATAHPTFIASIPTAIANRIIAL
jgi:hypothetical protein